MQRVLGVADSTEREVEMAVEELDKRQLLKERYNVEYLNSLGLQKGGLRGRKKIVQASWLTDRINLYTFCRSEWSHRHPPEHGSARQELAHAGIG